MDDFTNPGLFNLQALFIGRDESHPVEGAHIRVGHHPSLGLPAMPFILERAEVSDTEFERLKFREDATWRDAKGNRLTPPFSMDDGDEVTVTLPTGGAMAIWAQIIADPGSDPVVGPVIPLPPDRPSRRRPPGGLLPIPGRVIGGRIPPGGAVDGRVPDRFDPRGGGTIADTAFVSSMQVEGFLRSAGTGTKSLGTRPEPPFAFSGPGLVKLVIRGRGSVVGIRWLAQGEPQKGLKWTVFEVLNLPHKGGRRYLSLDEWKRLCTTRVALQVPKRRPMQDVDGATARMAAPAHSQSDEFDRVGTLFEGLEDPLDALIAGPVPQHQHVTRHQLKDASGDPIVSDGTAEASVPTLGLVLQGQMDPGTASYMGYKTTDRSRAKDVEHRLTFYRARGYFRNPGDDVLFENGLMFTLLMAQARQDGLQPSDALLEVFGGLTSSLFDELKINISSTMTPFFGFEMGALAVADFKAPLDPLPRPRLDAPRHVAWLPAPISDPRRATETNVRGVPASGALAVQMRQPQNSGSWRRLNRALDNGAGTWRALMIGSMVEQGDSAPPLPPGAEPPDTIISDTSTGPDTLSMHTALMDRFGRYSEWATALGDAGPRPQPPRPVVLGSYNQPDTDTLSRQGEITATVPLPEEDALAPGSFALVNAELRFEVDGALFATRDLAVGDAISIHPNTSIPGQTVPAGQDSRGLRVTLTGPAIPALQSRKLVITAIWRDTSGREGPRSEPVTLTMTDPYPPPQIAVPDVLDYAARPDATGTAWVERDIPGASSGVRHAVYYADENRMRDYLRNSGDAQDAALLDMLEDEADIAARATLLRAAQARFPGHLFERLENVVETLPNARFRHALPGTLRVLSAYKIAVEAAANAAGPDLSTLDTIFYGVPNADPPPRPAVSVKLVPPRAGEPDLVAEVTVTLRPGLVPGALARIRRTRSGVVDAIRNPILGAEPFGPIDPVTGLQTAVFRDIGAALIAPGARLMQFINYAWIAEAQGAEEPGSISSASGAVPGLWGPASAPATLTLVPETSPVPPVVTSSSAIPGPGGLSNVAIKFGYPTDLTPASPGPWHIRVERAEPGGALKLISEEPAASGTAFSVTTTGGETVPPGTRYRVRVIDPVGRESEGVDHVL